LHLVLNKCFAMLFKNFITFLYFVIFLYALSSFMFTSNLLHKILISNTFSVHEQDELHLLITWGMTFCETDFDVISNMH
jgi:hypothetical protein